MTAVTGVDVIRDGAEASIVVGGPTEGSSKCKVVFEHFYVRRCRSSHRQHPGDPHRASASAAASHVECSDRHVTPQSIAVGVQVVRRQRYRPRQHHHHHRQPSAHLQATKPLGYRFRSRCRDVTLVTRRFPRCVRRRLRYGEDPRPSGRQRRSQLQSLFEPGSNRRQFDVRGKRDNHSQTESTSLRSFNLFILQTQRVILHQLLQDHLTSFTYSTSFTRFTRFHLP